MRGSGVARASDNLQCNLGLAQVITAATPPQHLLYGATEVDVDDVKAGVDQPQRSRHKLFGLGAHQLTSHRAVFVVDVKKMSSFLSLPHRHEKLVQHNFAKCVLRPL